MRFVRMSKSIWSDQREGQESQGNTKYALREKPGAEARECTQSRDEAILAAQNARMMKGASLGKKRRLNCRKKPRPKALAH